MIKRTAYTIMLHDLAMILASFVAALWLRLGAEQWYYAAPTLLPALVVYLIIGAALFRWLRIPQRLWRFTSIPDLVALIKAASLTLVFTALFLFMVNRLEGVPRSVFIIQWFMLVAFLSAPRIAYRMLQHDHSAGGFLFPKTKGIQTVLIGLNSHSEAFLRDMQSRDDAPYRIIGIIDQDEHHGGKMFYGTKIYGHVEHTAKTIRKLLERGYEPQKLLIAPDLFAGEQLTSLLEIADEHGMTMSRIARVSDINSAVDDRELLRPVVVEDLLGRPQRVLDRGPTEALIEGRDILVTGAGGSIGSELCVQVANANPKTLYILDASEHLLFEIEQQLRAEFPELTLTPLLADIRQHDYISHLLKTHQPEVVLHAAALKHVPLCEANACEAFLTNTLATKHLIDHCIAHQVADFLMISTDKAVNPSSVMGCTKRLAESYLQGLVQEGKCKRTSISIIRFGNVLGSTGSVIPTFRKQIAKGGPLTVTDPEMKRYFMTIPEAVKLVLHTTALVASKQLQDEQIFVLDMGEPVRILDLAEQMIRLSGKKPYEDISITFTGLRPGEKLFEELFHGDEPPVPTDHQAILTAQSRPVPLKEVTKTLNLLTKKSAEFDNAAMQQLIRNAVPEFYQPKTN